jgi:hypothetical protein
MDGVFEIQAAVKLLGKRLSAIGDLDAPDDNEIESLSRVADLCVRSLDTIADMLDRVKTEAKREA